MEKTASEIATEVQARSGPDLLSAIMDSVRASGNRGMKEAISLSAEVLRILSATRGCPEVLIAFHPAGSSQGFFRNLFVLAEVLPSLPFAASDVAALHRQIPDEVFSNGAIGQYLDATRRWAAAYPPEGAALIESALGGDAGVHNLVSACLQGLGEAAAAGTFPADQVSQLASRLHQAVPELKAAAILATPSLVAGGLVSLDTFLLELSKLSATGNPEAVTAAAVNAGHLLWRDVASRPALRILLRGVASDSRPAVRLALVRALTSVWESGEEPDREVVRGALAALVDISEAHHGIIHDLFWLLYSMAKQEPGNVLSFLRSWTLREGDKLDLWDSRRFLNLFHELPRELFVRSLIQWLIEDPRLGDTALHILTTELGVEVIPPADVQGLPASELRILILTLSGLDHSGRAAPLLASLVSAVDLRTDAESFRSELEQALAHAVANFPSLAERLPADSALRNASLGAAVQRLKAHVQSVGQLRIRAARMKELTCPPERLQVYHRIEAESMGRAMREAEKEDPGRTPFLAMAKKVVMLTGGRFFSRHSGRFSTPTALQPFSTTIELPHLPILDPTSQNLRRAQIHKSLEAMRRGESP